MIHFFYRWRVGPALPPVSSIQDRYQLEKDAPEGKGGNGAVPQLVNAKLADMTPIELGLWCLWTSSWAYENKILKWKSTTLYDIILIYPPVSSSMACMACWGIPALNKAIRL